MILNSFVSTNSNVPPRLRRPAKTMNWPDGAQNSELQAFFSNRSVTLQQKPHKCPLQYNGKCKKKVVFPFCTIKVYRRSKVEFHSFSTLSLNSGEWLLHALAALPPGKNPGTHGTEGWWAPDPVWTFWRREKYLAPSRIQTPDCPAHNQSLYWLHYSSSWYNVGKHIKFDFQSHDT